MTMTPDQCFDEMAVALGLPKDTGYIDILARVKQLAEENEDNLASLNFYTEQCAELKDERKKLKEQNQRMSAYIDSYEVKYCETCLAYHMDTEEYGHGGVFVRADWGRYICDDCYDDLPDEEKCG